MEHLANASNVITVTGASVTAVGALYYFGRIANEVETFREETSDLIQELNHFRQYWQTLQTNHPGVGGPVNAQNMADRLQAVIGILQAFDAKFRSNSTASTQRKSRLFSKARIYWVWWKNRTYLETRVVHARNLKEQLMFAYVHLLTR